jgi:hypothetical protein
MAATGWVVPAKGRRKKTAKGRDGVHQSVVGGHLTESERIGE